MITRENGDTLFAAKTDAGMCGTDTIDAVWAKDTEEAYDLMIDWAREWKEQFDSGEDDDLVEYEDPDLIIEPWDDEVHPSLWPGGCKYAKDFQEDE